MDSPTVLCINDLPQVLELRKATLESHHYCVKIASSGYTAMKILLEYKTEGMDAEAVAYQINSGFRSCRSYCFQRTPTCQSVSCGWWMNT